MPQWPDLIRYKGPYDTHRGVQLLLTALLGQCYAMMSKVRGCASQVEANLLIRAERESTSHEPGFP